MPNDMQRNSIEEAVIIHDINKIIELYGILGMSPNIHNTQKIIIFAHGSGSGRFSPRNQFVASVLQKYGLGTLLLDLLTEKEAQDRSNVFDIELLANRLNIAKNWVIEQRRLLQEPFSNFKIGFFGASTGAGAALVAAANEPDNIYAIVSRGGRPDMAGEKLKSVKVPTLLLVGGDDLGVIELNKLAYDKLKCTKKLTIIPGATHLFEEPGTLEQVADLAAKWFKKG